MPHNTGVWTHQGETLAYLNLTASKKQKARKPPQSNKYGGIQGVPEGWTHTALAGKAVRHQLRTAPAQGTHFLLWFIRNRSVDCRAEGICMGEFFRWTFRNGNREIIITQKIYISLHLLQVLLEHTLINPPSKGRGQRFCPHCTDEPAVAGVGGALARGAHPF